MKMKGLLIFIIIFLILGFYEVKPFSGYIDRFLAFTRETPNPLKENKSWDGEYDRDFKFNAKTPPYILRIGVTRRTTNLQGDFNSFVYHEDDATEFGALGLLYYDVNDFGARKYLLQRKGNYVIKIKSSGYKWYAKIE